MHRRDGGETDISGFLAGRSSLAVTCAESAYPVPDAAGKRSRGFNRSDLLEGTAYSCGRIPLNYAVPATQ
jgi:hypothetical protein